MINVPISNPIRFRPLIGQTDTNFDNTFAKDFNGLAKPYAQPIAADDWYIQVVSDVDYYDPDTVTSDLVIRAVYADDSTEYMEVPIVTYVNGYYYYLFTMRPNYTGCVKFIVELYGTGEEYFESEWCENIITTAYRAANPDIFKLEWFNNEAAFTAEYAVTGFVPLAYVSGRMTYQTAGGEAVIFDNLGEEVKLKEIVQRIFKFDAELPDYLCEVLTVGMAHDFFYINDVQFVTSKKPIVTQLGRSNICKFEAEVKQVTIPGLNTHDTGFDCDAQLTETIMNLLNENKAADFTDDMPAGYLLHVITVVYKSGTTSDVSVGTTLGGTDVMAAQTITTSNDLYTEVVHLPFTAATTLYVTVDGDAVVDVNFQLIKNN